MSKKVLILSTSPRRGSNSEALAQAFARGAAESGHEVELIALRDKELRFCRGCFACQKTRQMRDPRRHAGDRPQDGAGRRAGLCHAHLLLRDERADEDAAGPGQSAVRGGLPLPRRVPAGLRGGGRGLCPAARRQRSGGLDRVLPQSAAGRDRFRRRRDGDRGDEEPSGEAAGGLCPGPEPDDERTEEKIAPALLGLLLAAAAGGARGGAGSRERPQTAPTRDPGAAAGGCRPADRNRRTPKRRKQPCCR